ncbi:MAG: hypothetical protein ACOCRK_01810 [bacterium]
MKKFRKNQKSKKLIVIASILTILMAVPHFFVPFIFPWESLTKELYPTLKWALFAMNFFYSLLLLWGGLLSLNAILRWRISNEIKYYLFGGLGLFWLIGAIYEIIYPFPIEGAKYIMLLFALLISLLYVIGMLYLKVETFEKKATK